MTRKEAQKRNFLIFRLREMWGMFGRGIVQPTKTAEAARDKIREGIDELLTELGAETESARRERFRESILRETQPSA